MSVDGTSQCGFVEPTPRSDGRPDTRRAWIAIAIVLALCLGEYAILPGSGIQNPWLAMTGPWCPGYSTNTLLGYASLGLNGDVLHNENSSLFADQAMLAGRNVNPAFYALRPGVGLVSYLVFWLDSAAAAQFAVLLLGLASTVFTFLLARRCGNSCVTAMLFALFCWHLGIVSFHLHDLSSHIGASAGWMAATLAAVAARPWDAGASRVRLACAHATMICALLFYWANIPLYFAFVLVMLPYWRRAAIGLAVLVAGYGLRAVWPALINYLYGTNVDYAATEQQYLASAVASWHDSYATDGIAGVLVQAGQFAAEAIFAEPAACLLAVSVAVLFVVVARGRSPRHWLTTDRTGLFALLSALGALGMLLIWVPAATARGYLVYGLVLGLLVLLMHLLGMPSLTARVRRAGTGVLCVMLGLQTLWATSFALGNVVPVCQYMSGAWLGTKLPAAYVDGFRHPVRFLSLDAHHGPQDLASMAATIRQSVTAASKAGPLHRYEAINGRSWTSLWRSFALGAFLLASFMVAITCALHARASNRRSLRGIARSVVVVAGTLWWVAWCLSPATKRFGVDYLYLTHTCNADSRSIEHPVRLTVDSLAEMRDLGVDRLRIVTGWQRGSGTLYERGMLQNRAGTRTLELDKNATVSLGELVALAATPDGAAEFTVKEEYSATPQTYIGWQPTDGSELAPTCDNRLRATLELRGYRPGGRVPALIVY